MREEDVHPGDSAEEEEALAVLGALPADISLVGSGAVEAASVAAHASSVGDGDGPVARLSSALSAWLRIEELQRPRRGGQWSPSPEDSDDAESGADGTMLGSPQPSTLQEFDSSDTQREFIRRSLLIVALALKAIIALLLVALPLTFVVYGALTALDPMLAEQRLVQRTLFVAFKPLDQLLRPLLVASAEVLGMDREEVLGERGHSCEGSRCAMRVLLGLVVLTVITSAVNFALLALLVLLVRISGVML